VSLKGGHRPLTETPHPAPPPEIVVVDAQLPQIPPAILAAVAQEADAAAQRGAALLQGQPGASRLSQARRLLRRLSDASMQAQRVARMLGGDYLPVREHVALDAAVRGAVEAAGRRGTDGAGHRGEPGSSVRTELHAVSVWMDPAVLDMLLELALDWALDFGHEVSVRVAFGGEPLHPDLLVIASGLSAPGWHERAAAPRLSWQLFELLARSQVLDPQRILTDDSAVLLLRFPPTVREDSAEGVAVSELPRPQIDPGMPGAGCHVAVVEPDTTQRLLMRQLLHEAGMQVEAFATPRQAEELAGSFLAEALVNGYPADDPDVIALLAVLRERNPGVRVIQLTEQDYLYIGTDDDTQAARVGRASVRQALVQAVLLSVGVFAPPTLAAKPG
jgi:CheY-like chemotaxis protein